MLANQRPKFNLRFGQSGARTWVGDRVSQSATLIQKFHDTPLARAIFHSHFQTYLKITYWAIFLAMHLTSFAINLFTIWRNPIKLIARKVEKNEISEGAEGVAAEDE